MEHMLNHFCRVRRLVYKQGLNEIIAPFVILREGGCEIERAYALFAAFFDSYGLNFYYDKVRLSLGRTLTASKSCSAWWR
jgi:hypothetical protein